MNGSLLDFISNQNQQILDIIPSGVYITDTNNKIKYWNRPAEIITGYSFSELSDTNILNLFDLNSIGSTTILAEFKQPGKTMLGQLIKHKHKLGGFITSEYYKNPVFSTEGELIGSIALFHDKTTEMAKTESQKKFYKSISEYLSLHTVQNIYNNVYFGADSFQEEKELTVAFIDIVNYTLLCEEYPEETIMRMLNVFYEKSASYIQNYRGIIDKFIGDCVLGYFIKPDACIKAAKDLLGEGLFSLNKKLRYLNLPEISFRIGIDTGKVKIGNIGGAFRKEYTLIGDTVNTASRIQGIAPPRSIVFTENTYSKLINKRGIKYMDEVKVKGKKNTIKLYALHYKA